MAKGIKKLLKSIDEELNKKSSWKFSKNPFKIKAFNKNKLTVRNVAKYAKSRNVKFSKKELKNIVKSSSSLDEAKRIVRINKRKQDIQNINKTINILKKKYSKSKDIELAKKIKSLEIQKKNLQLSEYMKQTKKALKEANIQKAHALNEKVKDIMQKKDILKVTKAKNVAGWQATKTPTSIENWILDNYGKEFKELKQKGKSDDEAYDILIKKAINEGRLKEGKHGKKTGHYGLIDNDGDVHSPR